MKKTYLLTPGPTPMPENVAATFARPIIHHRTPEFEKLFQETRDQLKRLFQTKQEVLILTATGTGAMDAAVSNLFSAGDSVITLNAGKFGERWTKVAKAYGLNVHEIKVTSGETIEAAQVEAALATHSGCKGVLFQASETSTGVKLPVREIVAACRARGVLSVCDAITALGVFDLPMDEWGIDALITGSQKAMMIPPGLAFIALSDRAWAAQEKSSLPRFYFDLARERKNHAKNQTAWTPAISLIQGLREALGMIEAEGLQNLFKRHDLLARATRAAAEALGLEMLVKEPAARSQAVTAIRVPSSIPDGKKIVKLLRDKHGVTMVGGQDELEGKIVRLAHIGYCGPFDIVTGIAALELVLNELGHSVAYGKGVGAALKVLAEG